MANIFGPRNRKLRVSFRPQPEPTPGTVWLDAKDVNAEQIRKGLAWAYRYHGKPIKPDYAALEDEARRLAIGLWSAPDQTEPWRWRKQHQG
ncbi:TPA: thermonuclease family protein [Citrobacter braakii]|nr:thermonuclease family protein [Citrobacter braakii]